jgi:hypothetical protein
MVFPRNGQFADDVRCVDDKIKLYGHVELPTITNLTNKLEFEID